MTIGRVAEMAFHAAKDSYKPPPCLEENYMKVREVAGICDKCKSSYCNFASTARKSGNYWNCKSAYEHITTFPDRADFIHYQQPANQLCVEQLQQADHSTSCKHCRIRIIQQLLLLAGYKELPSELHEGYIAEFLPPVIKDVHRLLLPQQARYLYDYVYPNCVPPDDWLSIFITMDLLIDSAESTSSATMAWMPTCVPMLRSKTIISPSMLEHGEEFVYVVIEGHYWSDKITNELWDIFSMPQCEEAPEMPVTLTSVYKHITDIGGRTLTAGEGRCHLASIRFIWPARAVFCFIMPQRVAQVVAGPNHRQGVNFQIFDEATYHQVCRNFLSLTMSQPGAGTTSKLAWLGADFFISDASFQVRSHALAQEAAQQWLNPFPENPAFKYVDGSETVSLLSATPLQEDGNIVLFVSGRRPRGLQIGQATITARDTIPWSVIAAMLARSHARMSGVQRGSIRCQFEGTVEELQRLQDLLTGELKAVAEKYELTFDHGMCPSRPAC